MKPITAQSLFLIIITYNFLFCDSIIKGTVIEMDGGKPIQNVNIFVHNQKIGTKTNENGAFELLLKGEESYLINTSHHVYVEISNQI